MAAVYPPSPPEGLVYRQGTHLWDMGVGGDDAFMLEATPVGIAVLVGMGHKQRCLGYLGRDELRAFLDYEEGVCWHCGRGRAR